MKKPFVMLLCALLLAACGGGGSSGGGSSSTSTPIGGSSVLVANAGTAQRVFIGSVVSLDGSGSSAANTYLWSITSKPAGSSAVLSSSTVVKPTFTANVVGDYVLSLVVNDGKLSSVASTVTITAISSGGSSTVPAGSYQCKPPVPSSALSKCPTIQY